MTGTGKGRTIGPLPGGNGGAIMQNKANFGRPIKVTSACEARDYERKARIMPLKKQSQFADRGWSSLATKSWTCFTAATTWSPTGPSTSRSPTCEKSSARGGTISRRSAALATASGTESRPETAYLAIGTGAPLPLCRCVSFFLALCNSFFYSDL